MTKVTALAALRGAQMPRERVQTPRTPKRVAASFHRPNRGPRVAAERERLNHAEQLLFSRGFAESIFLRMCLTASA